MIEIALCTDNNYAMPAGVMIYSVCKHTSDVSFNVIVSDGFCEGNKAKLKTITDSFSCHIRFIKIPKEILSDFPVGRDDQPAHISIATYYRLYLGQLLPNTINKVIYLDCDLICMSSLSELWNIDLNNAPIACVNDVLLPWQQHQERLGYDASYRYFNAGVLLINLDYWRKHNVIADFLSFLGKSADKIQFHDQDILNYVFHETAVSLPPRFNAVDTYFHKEYLNYEYQNTAKEIDDARNNPVIVHFTYKNKPWVRGGSHTYRDVFLKYKKNTPWKNYRLKTKKASTFKGVVANILVCLGLYRYHDDYIVL